MIQFIHSNNKAAMAKMTDNSIDACVTDAPYGTSFMNQHWDYNIPDVDTFKEIFRVLKPGAFIVCACGTRTQHRMAVNIEDAGFEIRDVICWHYSSGFPKSMNVSKAIDDFFGAEREIVSKGNPVKRMIPGNNQNKTGSWLKEDGKEYVPTESVPITDKAKQFDGWGTALKPATEFWTLARKPISENTVAENVIKHSTGGLHINACRIPLQGEEPPSGSAMRRYANNDFPAEKKYGDNTHTPPAGRYPANVIFDEFTGQILDAQSGNVVSGAVTKNYDYSCNQGFSFGKPHGQTKYIAEKSEGGASRFFYCSKAASFEKNKGLENLVSVPVHKASYQNNRPHTKEGYKYEGTTKNMHPTVKPISLMRWLVRLVTPVGGIVLDPYNGSGTTGIACKLENFNYIGIEDKAEYVELSKYRIEAWEVEKEDNTTQLELF